MSRPYYAHALNLPDANLTQFTNANVSYGLAPLIQYSSGDYAPMFTGASFGAPSLNLPTRQLRTVATLVSPASVHGRGRTVCYNASSAASDLYYRQGEPFAIRYALDAANAHEILRFSRSLLVWESITAQQGSPAEATVQLLPTYDGVNAPLVQLSGTIPILPDASEQFTLGPVIVNGVRYDGLQRCEWRNNVRPELIPHSGLPFNTYAGVASYEPRATVAVRDAALHALVGPTGLAVTSLAVYFRRWKQHDIAYLDSELQHISIVAALGTGHATAIDSAGRVSVVFNAQRASAVSEPFAISYDVAIPSA